MTPSICDSCGHELAIGEHPFCPHGFGGGGSVIDDTLPGGARWMHNLGDRPIFISTKTEYKQELAKRGLVQSERNNYNKSDKSPWATRTRLRIGQRDPFIHRA